MQWTTAQRGYLKGLNSGIELTHSSLSSPTVTFKNHSVITLSAKKHNNSHSYDEYRISWYHKWEFIVKTRYPNYKHMNTPTKWMTNDITISELSKVLPFPFLEFHMNNVPLRTEQCKRLFQVFLLTKKSEKVHIVFSSHNSFFFYISKVPNIKKPLRCLGISNLALTIFIKIYFQN